MSAEPRPFKPLKIAILTVSDTRNETTDKSGALLVDRLRAAGHTLAAKTIVRDDIYAIRAIVSAWIVDPNVEVAITTGGTGITGRDGTPEAIAVLLDKQGIKPTGNPMIVYTSTDDTGFTFQAEMPVAETPKNLAKTMSMGQSPDGKALTFQSEREADNPFYQIYVLDLESGDVNRVSPGHGKTTCSFFRAGTDEVMFASTHLDPRTRELEKEEFEFRASGKQRRYSWDYDPEFEIYAFSRGTRSYTRLTTARGYDAEASYSPDGQWIAFTSMRDAYNHPLSAQEQKQLEVDPSYFAEIYIMRADGSDQRLLTTTPGYDGGPFFSPDGRWIGFLTPGKVKKIAADGAALEVLVDIGDVIVHIFRPEVRSFYNIEKIWSVDSPHRTQAV